MAETGTPEGHHTPYPTSPTNPTNPTNPTAVGAGSSSAAAPASGLPAAWRWRPGDGG